MQLVNIDKKKVYVGYDLGDEYCQISYFLKGMEEPGTASTIADSEIFEIPVVLAKRKGVNQWYYGNEALKLSSDPGFTLVDSLLSRAVSGDMVAVEENEYDAVSLLTLYIKRSLSVLSFICSLNDISDVMISTAAMTGDTVRILKEVSKGLGLKGAAFYYEDHSESFFHYVMHNGTDFRNGGVQAFSLSGGVLKSCFLDAAGNTKPMVIVSEENSYEGFEEGKELDSAFLKCLEEGALHDDARNVFLTGSIFSRSGIDRSVRFILEGRKAYEGSNLFSKGAVFSLIDRAGDKSAPEEVIFLGKDKLRANLGMKARVKGEEVYYPLLDAGKNWYEAECEVTFVLTEDNTVPLVITPIDGKKPHVELLALKDPPDRPAGTFRLKMSLKMTDVKNLLVHIEDDGFGQLYQKSGLSWTFRVKTE